MVNIQFSLIGYPNIYFNRSLLMVCKRYLFIRLFANDLSLYYLIAHSKPVKGVAIDSVNLVLVSGSSDGFIKVSKS